MSGLVVPVATGNLLSPRSIPLSSGCTGHAPYIFTSLAFSLYPLRRARPFCRSIMDAHVMPRAMAVFAHAMRVGFPKT